MQHLARRLLDPGSFAERFPTSQRVTAGSGTAEGRPVAVAAIGPGSAELHEQDVDRVVRMQERAGQTGCPLVYLFKPTYDPDVPAPERADLSRLLLHRRGFGGLYAGQVRLSGVVPQVGLALAPMAGPLSFPAPLCDVLAMVENESGVAVGNADNVARLLGSEVSFEKLAGAKMHCSTSGVGDALLESESDALGWARRYLAFMPSQRGAAPPRRQSQPPADGDRSLREIVPTDPVEPFDVHAVIERLADGDSILELKDRFAPELVTALARLEGRPVGILANNSRHRGGILFPSSCRKAARFVHLCDAFGIPLLFLVDTVGFMIGPETEQAGMAAAAARLFQAIAAASVRKVAVVLRKAHTAGVYAMCGPAFGPDAFLAVEGATVSVLGEAALSKLANGDPEIVSALARYAEGDARTLARRRLIDGTVPLERLRTELSERFDAPPRAGRRRTHQPIWQI